MDEGINERCYWEVGYFVVIYLVFLVIRGTCWLEVGGIWRIFVFGLVWVYS